MSKENNNLRKLKRVLLKEEMFALTDNVNHAIVLNQMIYWSERTKDAKKFLDEELQRARQYPDGSSETKEEILETLESGWIYKTAEDMIDDCMLKMSKATMTRVFEALVKKGWLDRRNNPKYKWDKTWQYRVNLNIIQKDLNSIGYALDGYNLPVNFNDEDNGNSEEDSAETPKFQNESSEFQNESSKIQYEPSVFQNESSMFQNETAIPEITTETTIPEITTEITNHLKEEEEEEYIYKQLLGNIFFQSLEGILLEKNCSPAMIKNTIIECDKLGVNEFTMKSVLEQYNHIMEKELDASKGIGTGVFDFPLYFADGLKKKTDKLMALGLYKEEKEKEELEKAMLAPKPVPFYNWLEERD